MSDLYYLVHGAWHGSWCWDTFIPLLKSSTLCDVRAIDLPGRSNVADASQSIGLAEHVDFLCRAIRAENRPVILVGHSLAGVVISQVAEQIPQLIKQLCYITAYVPEDQHSMFDEVQKSRHPGVLDPDLVMTDDAISVKKTNNVRSALYAQSDVAIAEACLQRLIPEPKRLFFDKVSLTDKNFGRVPKKYIACSNDVVLRHDDQKRMYERLSHCEVVTLPADHCPFLSMPLALLTR